jgi:tetratricopeptide (TPR) repeat protein
MENDSQQSFQANLMRGRLLRTQGRHPDAEKFLQAAVAEQPENADAYFELAFCYCNWPKHEKKALATIDRAISLAPGRAHFFALRAWILGNLDKHRDAIAAAGQALEIDPSDILALNARSRAYVELHEWTTAEANARHTLSIDAGNELAANILAITLRQQGRLQESDAVTASLLSQVPDDALAQTNAGWSALQAGDYRRANRHFMEALRLDPHSESARSGLLHAFSSRVWIYRIYFRYLAWMSRHKTGMRYFLIFMIYLAYRFMVGTIRMEYGSESTDWILVIVALYFILFGYGRSFGHFFLLLDRFARHALTTKEKTLSSLVALGYGLLVFIELADRAWLQAGILLGIAAFFLWAALMPRLQDALSSQRTDDLRAES